MDESMQKWGIPKEEIDGSLREPILRRNRNKEAVLAYSTALLDALSHGSVVIGRHA